VSFVGRNVLGVGLLQVNASVNPGNSGGPLLDERGEVVGIVSMKVMGTDGLGLALPIEYARPHAGLPPAPPEAELRWKRFIARIEAEDRLEAEKFVERMARPTILGARSGIRGAVALFVGRRFGGSPYSLPIDVEIRSGDRIVCSGSGTIDGWQPMEKALANELDPSSSAPQARWALRNGIARDVFVGVATVDLRDCKATDVPEKAVVAIRGSEPFDRPVAFPREAFGMQERYGRYVDHLDDDRVKQQRAQSETRWRQAFRKAHDEIARLELRHRELEEYVARTPSDERAKAELAKIEVALPQARTAREDLERQASLEAVPREWRQ
jgi:hypothetical protein